MRGITILVGFLVLLPPAAAEASGPVVLDIEFNDLESCSLGAGDLCLLSHDAGADAGVGDDRVDATRIVERAGLTLNAPGAPPIVVSVRPEDMELRHPLFFVLEGAWLRANETLPPEARTVVTLEARAMNTGEAEPPRGVLVVVHPPDPVPNPVSGEEYDFVSMPLSWDCSFYFSEYGRWNEACSQDSLRPLPHGAVAADSSDRAVAALLALVDCDYLGGRLVPQACPVLDAGRAGGASFAEVSYGLAPEVRLGTGLEEVSVAVLPSGDVTFDFPRGGGLTGFESLLMEGAPGPSANEDLATTGDGTSSSASSVSAPLGPAAAWDPPVALGATALAAGPFVDPSLAYALAGAVAALLLAAALFHRIGKQDVLAQETRRRIHAAIAAQPGIRAGTLATLLGVDYKTVVHHVKILEGLGVVERTGTGHHPLFIRDARMGVEAKRKAVAAATPVGRQVLSALQAGPEIELWQLASSVGLPKSSVSTAVARLEAAGHVVRRRAGRRMFVALATPPPVPGAHDSYADSVAVAALVQA